MKKLILSSLLMFSVLLTGIFAAPATLTVYNSYAITDSSGIALADGSVVYLFATTSTNNAGPKTIGTNYVASSAKSPDVCLGSMLIGTPSYMGSNGTFYSAGTFSVEDTIYSNFYIRFFNSTEPVTGMKQWGISPSLGGTSVFTVITIDFSTGGGLQCNRTNNFVVSQSSVIHSNYNYFRGVSNSLTLRGVSRDYWIFPGTGLVLNGTNWDVSYSWLTNVVYGVPVGTSIYANTAGTSTYANTAGTSYYSSVGGTSSYSRVAGTSYYATVAGTSAYSYKAGTSYYATVAGTSTYAMPVGTAAGDLSGNYPNPDIRMGAIVDSDVNGSAGIQGTKINAGTTSTRGALQLATDLESISTKAVAANDTRLSNARTPLDHGHGSKNLTTGASLPLASGEILVGAGITYLAGWNFQINGSCLIWGVTEWASTTPNAAFRIQPGQDVGGPDGNSLVEYWNGASWINYSTAVKATFSIKHPIKALSDKKVLIHSCIEGPKVDLIYRGVVKLNGGKATVNIDKESNMSEGTFTTLTQNRQFFLQNKDGWEPVLGQIVDNELTIISKNAESKDEISWMVVAERNDPTINADPRVKNGHLQTEFDQVPGPESDNVMKTQDGVFYKVK